MYNILKRGITMGRELNVKQKEILKYYGLDHRNFLFISKDYESMTFIERNTKNKITLRY